MSIEESFLTKSKFTKLVEATVTELKIPYMEAVLYLCEKNDMEPEDMKKFKEVGGRRWVQQGTKRAEN